MHYRSLSKLNFFRVEELHALLYATSSDSSSDTDTSHSSPNTQHRKRKRRKTSGDKDKGDKHNKHSSKGDNIISSEYDHRKNKKLKKTHDKDKGDEKRKHSSKGDMRNSSDSDNLDLSRAHHRKRKSRKDKKDNRSKYSGKGDKPKRKHSREENHDVSGRWIERENLSKGDKFEDILHKRKSEDDSRYHRSHDHSADSALSGRKMRLDREHGDSDSKYAPVVKEKLIKSDLSQRDKLRSNRHTHKKHKLKKAKHKKKHKL